jgi:hypothetical protein
MICKSCIHCRCIGTRKKDGIKLYECHRDKPIWLGENLKNNCEFWEDKGNIIIIFDGRL